MACACLDHDDGGAWLFQAVDELFQGVGRDELAFLTVFLDQFVGTPTRTVENGDSVAIAGQVTRQCSTHSSKADNTNICLFLGHTRPFH